MTRRTLLSLLSAIGLAPAVHNAEAQAPTGKAPAALGAPAKLQRSDAEWKKLLSPAAYQVLRHEGTERPFSSALNDEKRAGRYHCAGCDHPLFSAEMKFDSGTGWPSFHSTLAGAFETRTDFKLVFPRTEYHCVQCGGHHGHVFNDGPAPSGKRHCNNGVALKFVPAAA